MMVPTTKNGLPFIENDPPRLGVTWRYMAIDGDTCKIWLQGAILAAIKQE